MIAFLSSSPFDPETGELNPANHFIDCLAGALPEHIRALFVCSDPDSHERTDFFAADLRAGMERGGFVFDSYTVLDGRNSARAAELIADADLVILAGGHVPTQNRFFAGIDLRRLLADCRGVILGISAGSMNSAELVYAQPEEPGEATDPNYRRFLPGLGLTRTMILPHYQLIRNDVLDGLRVFEDIAYPDSMGRCFYALPDGSFLMLLPGQERLCGEAYRIADGKLSLFCRKGEIRVL